MIKISWCSQEPRQGDQLIHQNLMCSLPNLCAGSRSTSQGDAVVGVAGENKQSDKKERNKDNQNIDEKGKAESK